MQKEQIPTHIKTGLWIFQALCACVGIVLIWALSRLTSNIWLVAVPALAIQSILIGFRPGIKTFLEVGLVGAAAIKRKPIAIISGLLVGTATLLSEQLMKPNYYLFGAIAIVLSCGVTTMSDTVLETASKPGPYPIKTG